MLLLRQNATPNPRLRRRGDPVVLHTTRLVPREEERRQASEAGLLWLRASRRLEQRQVHQSHLWWSRAKAADPSGPELPDLSQMEDPHIVRLLKDHIRKCEEANRTRARADFRAWLMDDLQKGGGAAHKVAGDKCTAAPEADDVLCPREHNADLVMVTNHKALQWAQVWALPPQRRAPAGWEAELRAQVDETPVFPMSVEAVWEAVRSAPKKTAPGADGWIPYEWKGLGPGPCDDLQRLLVQAERELRWPVSTTQVVMALLPKPGGGERTIGLTSGFYRLYMRIRKPAISKWEDEHAGHWDQAVRGSSALRAAILREVRNDLARWAGMHVATILWDCAKFFDSLEPWLIGPTAIRLGFPARVFYLGMLVHRGARFLRHSQCWALPVVPEKSILAGCVQSVPWTRLILYDLLQSLHEGYRPTTFAVWVDDVPQTTIAKTRRAVQTRTVGAAQALVAGLQDLGCTMSAKSVLLTADPPLSVAIQRELAGHGIQVRCEAVGKDLGVDVYHGRRRRVNTQRKRFGLAGRRLMRIRALVKVYRPAKQLVSTGAWPQGRWGLEATGCAPSRLAQIRGSMAETMQIRKPGGCTTTAFALQPGGHRKDPWIAIPLSIIAMWVSIAGALRDSQLLLQQAWEQWWAVLSPAVGRWNRVTGHIAAVMATLWQYQWTPSAPYQWTDDEGTVWGLDPQAAGAGELVAQVFYASLLRATWRKAAKHHCGGGLESGGDLTAGLRLHRRAKHDPKRQGAIAATLQGALWPGARKHAAGWLRHPYCPFCRRIDTPGDEWHQLWDCPQAAEIMGTVHADTQQYLQQARAQQGQDPCLWCRGICPGKYTQAEEAPLERSFVAISEAPLPDLQCVEECQVEGQRLARELASLARYMENPPPRIQATVVATDASGGPEGSDRRLRRVGWGWVAYDDARQRVCGGSWGTLGGDAQTIPRGELLAATNAIAGTQGDLTLLTDAAYVVRGFSKGPRGTHDCHADLWARFWRAVAEHPGTISIEKVQAHRKSEDQLSPAELVKCWANEVADGLAGHGANKHRASPSLCERVRWYDGVCKAVLRRSCALLTWLHQHADEVKEAEAAYLIPQEERTEVAAERRTAAAEAAGHLVSWAGDGISCGTCGQTSGKRPLKWEGCECVPPSPWPGVHPSHIPYMRIIGEATVCTKCGKYATSGLRSFRKACTQPTASGKLVIRLAAGGREPYGVVRARRLRGAG
jgi:hypothetical protein